MWISRTGKGKNIMAVRTTETHIEADHYTDIDASDRVLWPWKNFPPHEMQCRHCGAVKVRKSAMDRLTLLRSHAGDLPMHVNSAYRCPAYNQQISSTGPTGPHTLGGSFDLQVHRGRAWTVMRAAMNVGFSGIGVAQKGATRSRFLHVDDEEHDPDNRMIRPTVWSY